MSSQSTFAKTSADVKALSEKSANKKDKNQSKDKLEIMRHSLAHLLAAAVLEIIPEAKFAIGPAIENGFYYDFDLPAEALAKAGLSKTLTPEDLPKIEKIMSQLIKKNLKFEKKVLPIKEAIATFKELGQDYKAELLADLKKEGEKEVSVYQTGNFLDLCRGPHIDLSGKVGAFKLTHLAGAYWKASEKNKMLTRIYGLAFATQKELDDYLKMLVEAEKRDHRKLGQELDLFSFDEEFGQGLPLWHPKGAILRQVMEDFVLKEYLKRGYQLVRTPHIASLEIFKTSGHWNFYRESMYSPMKIENEDYIIKPMNCPGHIKIYKTQLRSYRDLPIRYTELGAVYRYEKSGTLHGLTRVRGFTQDDAHIICAPGQLKQELIEVIKLAKYILKTFGFSNFEVNLSIRDPENKNKYLGDDKHWQLAEKSLAEAMKEEGWQFKIDEGEAVFYGPKMDIKVKDAIGRPWQISTLQVDFNLPERFDLTYIDEKGKKQRPIMLHQAILGSLERFTGLLIEHYAGAFPTWLSPVQIKIIPVGKDHFKYSEKLAEEFLANDFRVEVDNLNETVGYKIRKAEKQKVPYMLVIGDKETKGKTLNVRHRDEKDMVRMTIKKFIERIKREVEEKK
ncbi:MAG: threonine--tRNA ligase [bacterium]